MVIRSPTVPLSVLSATPGAAAATVSSVKLKLVAAETFPATSTCRTRTVFDPSDGVNDEDHVVPPFVEYCTVAPASTPESVNPP